MFKKKKLSIINLNNLVIISLFLFIPSLETANIKTNVAIETLFSNVTFANTFPLFTSICSYKEVSCVVLTASSTRFIAFLGKNVLPTFFGSDIDDLAK